VAQALTAPFASPDVVTGLATDGTTPASAASRAHRARSGPWTWCCRSSRRRAARSRRSTCTTRGRPCSGTPISSGAPW